MAKVEETGETRASQDNTGLRTYVRTFRVLMDSRSATSPEVLLAADATTGLTIPLLGDPLAYDLGAQVITRDPRRVGGDLRHWQVEVSYSSKGRDPAEAVENPLDKPPKWTARIVKRLVPLLRTVDGTPEPILNSAQEEFTDPPTEPVALREYTCTINRATNLESLVERLLYGVNATSFLNKDALTILFEDHAYGDAWDPKFGLYYQHTFKFTHRSKDDPQVEYLAPDPNADEGSAEWLGKSPWDLRLLDAGFNYLEDAVTIRPILRLGQPVSRPVPLDGAGQPLDPSASPVYLLFRTKKRVELNDLSLGSP